MGLGQRGLGQRWIIFIFRLPPFLLLLIPLGRSKPAPPFFLYRPLFVGAPSEVSMASKIPTFGAWEAGEDATYTVRFETARKGKPGGPIVNPNETLINQNAAPPDLTRPKPAQPKFGEWEDEEEVPYTQYFERQAKTNPNEPRMNRDVGPIQKAKAPLPAVKPKEKPKKPKFGAWEDEEEVPYTQYFEGQGKSNPNEPQMNRDVVHNEQRMAHEARQRGGPNPRTRSQDSNGSKSPLNSGTGGRGRGSTHSAYETGPGGPRHKPSAIAGPSPGRGARVPEFGAWNADPTQVGGYTVVFDQLHEDKKKGTAPNVDIKSSPYRNTPTLPTRQKKRSGFFSCLFG